MDIGKIGVIGAGQMGNGIAHVMALAGYEVVISDISQEALDKALESIRGMVPSPFRRPHGCTFHPRCDARIAGRCNREDPQLYAQADGSVVRCFLHETERAPIEEAAQ